jgi:hypothetical protein
MKIAVLEHTHKHGHDTYIAQVGDDATIKDQEKIIAEMIKVYGIDYEPHSEGQDEGFGEELELRLETQDDVRVLSIGFDEGSISKGVWRYSEEGKEVTTSHPGILEGSKRVCHVGNGLKPAEEVKANGMVIEAVPEMIGVLEDIRDHLNTNHQRWTTDKRRLKDRVDAILRRFRFSSVSGQG